MVYTAKLFEELDLHGSNGRLIDFMFYTAAPVLKRSKPSVLVNITFCGSDFDWGGLCGKLYALSGLCVKTLYIDGDNRRILIYDHSMLRHALKNADAMKILHKKRYRGDLNALLETLSRRYGEEKCPHEIGLFLGYPPEDVEGFIRNKGADSLLTGAWKVYGDVHYAKQKWSEWQSAKEHMAQLLLQGVPCQMAVKLILI